MGSGCSTLHTNPTSTPASRPDASGSSWCGHLGRQHHRRRRVSRAASAALGAVGSVFSSTALAVGSGVSTEGLGGHQCRWRGHRRDVAAETEDILAGTGMPVRVNKCPGEVVKTYGISPPPATPTHQSQHGDRKARDVHHETRTPGRTPLDARPARCCIGVLWRESHPAIVTRLGPPATSPGAGPASW